MSVSLGVEIHGLRNESHLLYVGSYAHAMRADFDAVYLVDMDARTEVSARATSWLQRLGPGIEVVDHLPASVDLLDRAHIGSPAVRHVFSRSGPRPLRRSIVVDEGLGSYGSVCARFSALRRQGTATPGALARAIVRTTAVAVTPTWRWRTYEPSSRGWMPNEAVAQAFRTAAEPADQSDRVVLLTQPWAELGLASETQVRSAVHYIAEAAAAAGFKLVVRAHPAETLRHYDGVETIHGSGPAELQAAVTGARLVVGETSSALLHLAAIFGVAATRVTGIASPVGLSRAQRELLDQFVGRAVPLDALGAEISRSIG